MSLLRVALVGCGIISEIHIRAYQHHADRAKIVVCCDIDESKARDRAALVGDARATTNLAEVLADPNIDAIEVCTPHHLHTDIVVAAAKAGKHIMCQKPLAKTLEECDIMIEAAREAGVTLFYGETNYTLPAVQKAKQAIAEGRIGQLVGLQVTYGHWQGGEYLSTAWRYDPRISGGGQLLDGGIHYIAMMLAVGGPITNVNCYTARFRPELGGEDTAVLNARFAGGQLGSLFSTQAAGVWFPNSPFVAFGTEGILTIGGSHGALALHRPDQTDGPEVLIKDAPHPFFAMTGSFLDCVCDGKPNISPGEVGRESLRVVLAAYQSAQEGRDIEVAHQW
jgi:predicted dehydrogenase